MPNLQPTLTGERVIIRPLDQNDWDEMYKVASDPKIWELHPSYNRYQEPVFRQFFDEAMATGSAFAFIDKSDGSIIGSSRYFGYDPDTNEIEIGWTFIACKYWGLSYNREIKTLMLDYAFTFADCAIFVVGDRNLRSRRAMEKIGGILRPGFTPRRLHGKVHNHVVYEIRKIR